MTQRISTVPAPSAAMLRALRRKRFIAALDHNNQVQLIPIEEDACVVSPKSLVSMSTLLREFVPAEMLQELMLVAIQRLTQRDAK